jgi:predicted transposase YbfD/YdcC
MNTVDPENFFNILINKWPDLGSFVRVHSIRKTLNGDSEEVRYYMTSLQTEVEEVARAIRAHWSIENQLHHVLDVTFKEDQSRVRLKNAAENMAMVRRMALNMLKQKDPKLSFKRKRHRCNWSNEYLEQTLWAQIQN